VNEALIKATFFLSVLSTENPEFPSVPLDPPHWKSVFSSEMTLKACEDLVTRYRLTKPSSRVRLGCTSARPSNVVLLLAGLCHVRRDEGWCSNFR
jgi:hypothetical protein